MCVCVYSGRCISCLQKLDDDLLTDEELSHLKSLFYEKTIIGMCDSLFMNSLVYLNEEQPIVGENVYDKSTV